MASAECHCCKGHDSCCICWLHHDFNHSKSIGSVPSVNGQTLSEWFGKAPKNSGTKSWKFFKERKLRLTASNFGKVNKRVKEPTESFFKAVFCSRNLGSIRSVSHGQANEKTARNVYAKECAKQIKNFRVFESGLLVNPDMPHLGATPDGKVYDPSMEEWFGLLEIKCPLVQKELSLEEAVSSKGFYLKKGHTNMYSLMKNHPHGYYDQVQGQLAISGLSGCDFVVYLSDSHEMAVIRILFDEEYWNSLLSKLNNFYVKSLPFIRSLST
ncbi:hypothetical protein BSL78_19892 [Apostichopus japonicus]|uniref:YqaJ viral recombinase domain-containing protein n=1 Tax=Stichopus japonicus TaxID=307972 RepID=A0A2G8K5G5_STIJA|nr:hypothetical protein BSL78_19892 [Apostichopus japonicus]